MTLDQWATIKHFKPSEAWGDPLAMHFDLLCRLDAWREFIGKEVIISCGTSGIHAKDSEHYTGEAVDCLVPEMHVLDQFISSCRFGFKSIGVYPGWKLNGKVVGGLHLGVRSRVYMAQWIGCEVGDDFIYDALTFRNLRAYGAI